MKLKKTIIVITLLLFLSIYALAPNTLFAHPGSTDPDGGHYCRTNCDAYGVPWNERHFHNPPPAPVAVTDTSKPKTYAKGTSAKRKGRRKIAKAKLRWRVRDNSSKAKVVLKIQKKVRSKSRAKKKARYLKLYRKYRKSKSRRNKKLAKKYKRAYRKTKTVFYKTVKNVRYGMTSINKWRAYRWRTRSRGLFRFLVYATDTAGNKQKNIAKGPIRIKKEDLSQAKSEFSLGMLTNP